MSSDTTISARALASRQNGARSRGPKTAAGKARAARNALRHGLSARRHLLLDDEDAAAFAAFEAAARTELAPAGEFQADLVARIVTAAWRARRADRLEAALLGRYLSASQPGDQRERQHALGLELIRDGNCPRALDTLVCYRGSVLAELFRALGPLKALQAEGRHTGARLTLLPSPAPPTKRTREAGENNVLTVLEASSGRPDARARALRSASSRTGIDLPAADPVPAPVWAKGSKTS